MKISHFYVNARLNRKTALLAGPFFTSSEAEATIEIVGGLFVAEEPAAVNATFGIMEVNGFAGYGRYNLILRQNGINVGIPEVETRH